MGYLKNCLIVPRRNAMDKIRDYLFTMLYVMYVCMLTLYCTKDVEKLVQRQLSL